MTLTSSQKNDLIQRWQVVLDHIANDKKASNATQPVTLLAVSKTQPIDSIATLAEAGQRDFGENYVQEAVAKIQALSHITAQGKPLIWHYIGHIQRNKTRELAEYFDWVEGVDRLIIAQRLNDQRPTQLPKLNICLQINIDNEDSKSGCHPDELPQLVTEISKLPNLCLRGLMIIPEKNSETAFERTQILFEQVKAFHRHPEDWDTLSMGMSADMKSAIARGATMVRIGTAIFGQRNY